MQSIFRLLLKKMQLNMDRNGFYLSQAFFLSQTLMYQYIYLAFILL